MNRTHIEIKNILKLKQNPIQMFSHQNPRKGDLITHITIKGKASKRLGNHPWASFCKLDHFLAFDAHFAKSGG